jgi:DNA-binding response OmpR family regulator
MTNPKGAVPAARADEAPSNLPRALRVLIAEDDRDTALTLMMILRDEGHEVRAVHSGRSVMGAVIDFGPHAVILDLHLPDISGWQIASTIRARRAKPPLLIAITGYFTKGADRILSQLTGFDHYVVKPCEPKELLKLLEPLRLPGSDSSLF